MEVADVAIKIDDGFAVELEHYTQHTMRRWMLRPHVQHHLRAIQQCLSSCRYLYLVHTKSCKSCLILQSCKTTLRPGRLRRMWLVTSSHTKWLDHQTNLFNLASFSSLP